MLTNQMTKNTIKLTPLLHYRNQQLPHTQLISFLVYRQMSVFLVDCIEHFFSVWVSSESAGINCHFLIFFYIVTSSYGRSFKEWFPFYLPPWILMPKNVFIQMLLLTYSSSGYVVTLIEEVCHFVCSDILFFLIDVLWGHSDLNYSVFFF